MSTTMLESAPVPLEPLEASASVTRELSTACCEPGAEGRGCGAYHGFWPYMRLMGLGKTLSGQADLYRDAIQDAALQGQRNHVASPRHVLVSGSVDYCILAHAHHALNQVAQPANYTVLDRCQTPLLLNRWYARRHGFDAETVCSDVLTFQADSKFDLILASSFFGYFDPASRQQLFNNYARWLRPGGRLVFTNRLRSGPEDQAVGFSPAQAAHLVEQAALLRHRLPPAAPLSEDDARALAAGYARCLWTYPFNGDVALQRLAQASGLMIVSARRVGTVRTAEGEVAGPTTSDGGEYLFAVLERSA
jgi:SAM-dependent methyltransferase